ncbi:MAG: alpha/beta hydrolase [Rhodospirillales bacterium]|nr:alpha/beta hydrolase [Rhodospirillales bacterium]
MLLPEVKKLLTSHLTPPSGAAFTVAGARAGNVRLGALLGGDPIPLARVDDRKLPLDNANPLNIRIYRPRHDADQPIVVYLHGGGWISGTPDAYDPLCRALAHHSKAVVISVDYPLAPEHPFPESLMACRAAINWIRRNAVAFGGDPAQVAIAGDSAGANLAAAAALDLGQDDGLPPVAHLALIYPILDARMNTASYHAFAEGNYLTAASMTRYWDLYIGDQTRDRTHPDISPGLAVDVSALPATTILAAECDPLRDEALAFVARLAKGGVEVTLRSWPGVIHGFLRFLGPLASARAAICWFGSALGAALSDDDRDAHNGLSERDRIRTPTFVRFQAP